MLSNYLFHLCISSHMLVHLTNEINKILINDKIPSTCTTQMPFMRQRVTVYSIYGNIMFNVQWSVIWCMFGVYQLSWLPLLMLL